MKIHISRNKIIASVIIILIILLSLNRITDSYKNNSDSGSVDATELNSAVDHERVFSKDYISHSKEPVRRIDVKGILDHEKELNDQYVGTSALEREYKYQHVQAVILAQELAKKYKGTTGKCLLIHHPMTDDDQEQLKQMMDSFKEGLGESFSLKAVASKEIDESSIAERELEAITAEEFNKIIENNSEYDMVITMVPLPFKEKDLSKISIFTRLADPDNPKDFIKDPTNRYVQLGVFNGHFGNKKKYFSEGFIDAMTVWKPDPYISEEEPSEIYQEAFDTRYLLITKETLALEKID